MCSEIGECGEFSWNFPDYKDPDNDVTDRSSRYCAGINGGSIMYRADIDRFVYLDVYNIPRSIGTPSNREWMQQFSKVYIEAKCPPQTTSEAVKSNWIDRWADGRQATAKDYERVALTIVEGIAVSGGGPVGVAGGIMASHGIAFEGAVDSAAKISHDVGLAMAECRADAVRDGYAQYSDIGI